MEFNVPITVEVDKVGDSLAAKTPVALTLVYYRGRWQARSESPLVLTELYETMEEALVAAAKELPAAL